MPKRRRTPQEKKRLALERDVVDMWGEPQKGFRKIKPRRKAQIARANRHAVSRALQSGADAAAVPRKRTQFWSGPRLGHAIALKLERRRRLQDRAEQRVNDGGPDRS
jgi:hypothetical protein